MKTTILDELNLPERAKRAFARESVRTGQPVNQLVTDFILGKAETITKAAERSGPGNGGSHPEMAA